MKSSVQETVCLAPQNGANAASSRGHGKVQQDQIKATVAVCTYNGKARIRHTLEALLGQTANPEQWEILVVDNASTDGTSEHVSEVLGRQSAIPWRVVMESTPGLSHARHRAAKEARGGIICFLDDDNLPFPEFVQMAMDAFRQRERAGSLGGKVLPKWEAEPTPIASAVASFALALCDKGDEPFPHEGIVGGVVGAGMCIRRDLLLQIYSDQAFARSVVGRKGKSLGAGEDLALGIRVKQMGWESWYRAIAGPRAHAARAPDGKELPDAALRGHWPGRGGGAPTLRLEGEGTAGGADCRERLRSLAGAEFPSAAAGGRRERPGPGGRLERSRAQPALGKGRAYVDFLAVEGSRDLANADLPHNGILPRRLGRRHRTLRVGVDPWS